MTRFQDRTQFVGVSIASALSFAESERLVQVLSLSYLSLSFLPVYALCLPHTVSAFPISSLLSYSLPFPSLPFPSLDYLLCPGLSASLPICPPTEIDCQGLKERGVAIDNLVVNQLLGDASDPAAVARIVKAQVKEQEERGGSCDLLAGQVHQRA